MCAKGGQLTWGKFWAIGDAVRQGQDRLQPREALNRNTIQNAYVRNQFDSMQYASRKGGGVKGGYLASLHLSIPLNPPLGEG